MKKKRHPDGGSPFIFQPKLLKFMKLLTLFLIGACLSIQATTYAQQTKVTLEMKQVSLHEVILEISKQTKLHFLYNHSTIGHIRIKELKADGKELHALLQELLPARGLEYSFNDDVIVISPKESTSPQKISYIEGKVTDKQQYPLPGVTVRIKNSILGTVTDKEGKFKLPFQQDGATLIFTFVGMETQEIEWKGQKSLQVIMTETSAEVDEVVVTGYQTIKEKSMAGAYSKVKAEDLIMTGNETVEQLLQGQLPGLVVTNTSGLTGTRQKVRVRGTSTLVSSAEPVWVVDGIIQEDNLPFEASELAAIGDDNIDMMRDYIGGAISWLNPNDIEDITVLKDASATAIYGVKAANGVILISTKKGERGRLSLNYTGNLSFSQRMNYRRQEVMNSAERVDLSREGFERGSRVYEEKIGYTGLALAYLRQELSTDEFHRGVKKLEKNNTNWFDILYRAPISQSHSLSFSGGNDNATYRASFGYREQQNTAKGNEQLSYTANLNTTAIFWNKLTITSSVSGNYAKTKAFASGVDPFNYAINTSRVIDCYDENELFYYPKNGYKYNILNELANSGNENTKQSLNLNVNVRWRLTDALMLSATLGGGISSSFAESWFTERSHNIAVIRAYEFEEYGVLDQKFQDSMLPYGGMLSVTESRNFNYTARLQAEYTNILNGLHALTLMTGMETRSNRYDGYSQINYGYQPDRGKSFAKVPVVTPSGIQNQIYAATNPTVTDRLANYVSYYVSGQYMYDNRYAANFSVRGDASNRFGDTKFKHVWSAGARWNVTNERWMQNQNMINNLDFKATLGYQGNVAENISPDFIAKILPVNTTTGEYQMTWSQLPNPELKEEKTLSVNMGLDFALFKSKLNGTFNWYYKKTTDVITSSEVPYENGSGYLYVNEGNITNKGWELSLRVIPVRTRNFMWSLGSSFSGNDNTINSKMESTGSWQEATSGSLNKKGYPIGSFWAFRFTGLNPENGTPLVDLTRATADKAAEDATEYMVYMGSREPTFTLGINMVFRWKRFSFPLNFYISRGNYEFLASPYENGYMMPSEIKNVSKELNKRWRKPGDEKYTDIPSIPSGDNCRPLYPFTDGLGNISNSTTKLYPLDAWAYSDIRVVNAWYIRFNNLNLNYDLPDKWIKGFAKNVKISFTATNPLQIKSKDFKGRDPEIALGKQPRSQDYSVGINMSF